MAIAERRIEARSAPHRPLDVLVQHGEHGPGGGFRPDELYAEVRQAWSYRELTDEHWQWALAFVRHGGHSLTAYPDYQRVEPDETGLWKVPSRRVALRHRMSIGTIVSDASLTVKFWAKGGSGRSLGSIEEGFIARLRPGDNFLFGGRLLELVRVENMTAYVSRATGKKAAVPRWNGGRMPLSSELADAVVEQLGAASREQFTTPKCARSNRCFASRWTVGAAHQDHLAGRGDEVPRRLAPVPLPLRRAPCAPVRPVCWPGAWASVNR